MRLTNIFLALSFVFISILCIANAQTAGGYSKVPKKEYKTLGIKLQNSNIQSALATKKPVKVVNIVSATQQVVAGMNYRIVAQIKINGKTYEYCFKVEQDLPPNDCFNVVCASKKKPCEPCPCLKQ